MLDHNLNNILNSSNSSILNWRSNHITDDELEKNLVTFAKDIMWGNVSKKHITLVENLELIVKGNNHNCISSSSNQDILTQLLLIKKAHFESNSQMCQRDAELSNWDEVFREDISSADYYAVIYYNSESHKKVLVYDKKTYLTNNLDFIVEAFTKNISSEAIHSLELITAKFIESNQISADGHSTNDQLFITGFEVGGSLAEISAARINTYAENCKVKVNIFESIGMADHIASLSKKYYNGDHDPKKVEVKTYMLSPNYINTYSPHSGKIYFVLHANNDLALEEKIIITKNYLPEHLISYFSRSDNLFEVVDWPYRTIDKSSFLDSLISEVKELLLEEFPTTLLTIFSRRKTFSYIKS